MHEIQRRLLAEAAKFGGKDISAAEKMANTINEAPAMVTPAPSPFGYSKPQFESRMRELIRRMGFEKGITNIRSEGSKMVVCFALAPKARDFMLTINKLLRIKSSGDVATMDTTFNPIKAPAGTKAIITLDFSKVRQESVETAAGDAADGIVALIEAFVDAGGVPTISEAYIKTEEIKRIRQELKVHLPQFRFSVARSPGGYGSISISILSGPVRFLDADNGEINHYSVTNYKNNSVLKKIVEIVNKNNWDRSDIQTDYFDVGFYWSLHQGYDKWRGSKQTKKGYILTDPSGKKPVDPKAVMPTAEEYEAEDALLDGNTPN